MKKLITMIFAAGCFALGVYADVSYSFNGGIMTITAPSTLHGKGISIVWDAEDKGSEPSAWANSTNVVDAVPASGGTYKIDLGACGITNGQPCRIVTSTRYRLLDMLWMTSKETYINTGIVGSDIYGIRFGYYPTGRSGSSETDFYYAIGCGKDNKADDYDRGAFAVGESASTGLGAAVRYYYRGTKYNPKKSMSTSEINEFAFTNGVFTLNDELLKSGLGTGSVSTNQVRKMYVGKNQHVTGFMEYGWWSHVSFDDANGNRILDYIPVQRASDGKVGFWNRIGDGSFVTSSGTGDFTAGTFTNAYIDWMWTRRRRSLPTA